MYQVSLGKTRPAVQEGIVAEWLKNEGQQVVVGDLLARIETSGALFELQASVTGTLLKVSAAAGMAVSNTDVLCTIGQSGEKVPGQAEKAVAPVAAPAVTPVAVAVNTQATASSEGVVPILMPQAGQSMEEGTLLSWKIKPGDCIEVGQVIFEIETDKATMDVEAVDAGRVARLVAKEGDIVEVKVPVAYLADDDASVDALLGGQGAGVRDQGSEVTAPVADVAEPVAVPAGVVPVLMPQAGQSMEEGTLLEWKVAPGDKIEVGQVIFDIETDKATMEVEAVDAGRVARILAQAGDIVEVKVPVAYLAENDADVDAYVAAMSSQGGAGSGVQATASATSQAAPQVQKTTATQQGGRVKASPAARKLAAQRGVDLTTVTQGSGPGGRILSSDVLTAKAGAVAPAGAGLSKMRRAIARNLLYSKQNIPHFYAKTTVNAGTLYSTYKKTKEQFKCTINDFVTAACAKAICELEPFRSQYQDDNITVSGQVNIGIAVGTDDGLTVPVVVDADKKSLKDLGTRTREVVEAARNGKLEGVGQGNFTITNLGMFGVEDFQAIINPPESAILAVGALREAAVVENGELKASRVMSLCVSVDHRVIDGVVAAQFLARVKELLEAPEQLL
ncbi:MAG: 2-oxo acid dehydrogenase subunit E2 [Phycisphaeraceae bacterium]|nr:2-oxo acid dehydrogenase subunit E2 [Phycisphaeraceae bacterium]